MRIESDDAQFLRNIHHPDEMIHIYSTSYNKNPPIIDENIVNHKFSKYELLDTMLKRLNGRYDKEELENLTHALGHPPCLLDNDQKDNIVATTKMIRRYLTDFKQAPNETPLIMDLHKYKDLLSDCDDIISSHSKPENENSRKNTKSSSHLGKQNDLGKKNNLGNKKIEINTATTQNIVTLASAQNSDLPTFVGGALSRRNELIGLPHLLDSGSSGCVLSFNYLSDLGYTMDDLKNKDVYSIQTAGGVSQALGTITLETFLKNTNGQFYKFRVEYLVISNNMNKVILGYNFLTFHDFKWANNKGDPQVTLDCLSRTGTHVRRVFKPTKTRKSHELKNINHMKVYSMSPMKVKFRTSKYIDVNNAGFWSDNPNMFLLTQDEGIVNKESVTYKLTADPACPNWPVSSEMIFETNMIFKHKKFHEKNTLSINLYTFDAKVDDYLQELYNMEMPNVDEARDTISDMDNHLYDKVSLFPGIQDYDSDKLFFGDILEDTTTGNTTQSSSTGGPKERKYYEPKVDHLTADWQDRYKLLFEEFKDTVSRGKYHVGRAKLPPVKFNIPPGASSFDPVRPHSEREYAIIEKYVQELLQNDVIEQTDGSAAWNSNILLVSTHSESAKRQSTAIADRISREEMLKKLEESSRVCLDYRKVNATLPLMYQTVTLPSLHAILPNFCNRLVSKVDISKAFYSILVEESSRDCTTFRVRDKCYRFKVPPMGYHSSPGIWVAMLNRIINEESFEVFKKQHPKLKNVTFIESYIKYIDDVAILSTRDEEIHFLLWVYLLERFREFGLLINLSKSQILESKTTEYLGINIDFSSSTYSLTPDRYEAIRSWEFPRTKRACISRLACLNYFRTNLFSLKLLISNLMLLCRDDAVYKPTLIHVREFQWLQLLACLNIKFQISLFQQFIISSENIIIFINVTLTMKYEF